MKIFKDFSLKSYNSFGIDCKADSLISVNTEEEAISLLKDKKFIDQSFSIIGGGTNLLFTDDFKGTLLHSEIENIIIEEEHPEYIIVSAGSGVIWDKFVEWCVNYGYGGVENLSLIPGLVGATPVQNIGAYGVEIKDVIDRVRTVSTEDGSVKEFSNKECRFEYRSSLFKEEIKNKYLITRVLYRLSTLPVLNTEYGSLKDEMSKLREFSIIDVREAVIRIRKSKLPDPGIIGNAGSFFKNPVVDNSMAEQLKKHYPAIPIFNFSGGGKKLAAAWLIEQCGWKGKRIGDAGVFDKQPLVLVNYGSATGREIYNLSEEIKRSVTAKFGIELEREAEIIGST